MNTPVPTVKSKKLTATCGKPSRTMLLKTWLRWKSTLVWKLFTLLVSAWVEDYLSSHTSISTIWDFSRKLKSPLSELQELETNTGLLILTKLQEKEPKDITLKVTKSLFFRDVWLSFVLTDKQESESFATLIKTSVSKNKKCQKKLFCKVSLTTGNHLRPFQTHPSSTVLQTMQQVTLSSTITLLVSISELLLNHFILLLIIFTF